MRRRTCAAVVLCGSLVAGCGTATRIDFASHSRPASPVDVSVYVGNGGVALDPTRLSPGPVTFNIANQSRKRVSVTITLGSGRTVTHSPSIPAGGTAELKATLGARSATVGLAGQPSSLSRITIVGRARTGDNELTQP